MGFISGPVVSAALESYLMLEEQAARIEAQIHQLRTDLAHIRERRNFLVPVNSIPDEVLLSIFAHLIQPADPAKNESGASSIVSISHACGRWRKISLNAPKLWTEVPLVSVEWADLLALRSRSLPLSISLNYRSIRKQSTQGDLYGAIRSLVPRLRALHLSLSDMQPISKISEWSQELPDPAPILEELYLHVDGSVTLRFRGPPNPNMLPHFSIFGNSTPALRSLTLNQVAYPSVSPLFHNLRHLRLLKQDPYVPELLRILRRSPNLETLSLEEIHEHPDPIVRENILGPVTLSRLSYLQISATRSEFPGVLLKHLSLPATVRFHIALDEGWALSLPRLPGTLPALVGLRFIRGVSRGHVSPHLSIYAGHVADTTNAGTLFIRPVHMHRIANALDTSAVESYVMHLGKGDDFVSWNLALQDMPALKTLQVVGEHGSGLFHGLLRGLSAEGEAGAGALCPSLETLVLVYPYCDADLWDALKKMADGRGAGAGGRLRRVILEDATGIVEGTHPSVQAVRALLADELRITCTG